MRWRQAKKFMRRYAIGDCPWPTPHGMCNALYSTMRGKKKPAIRQEIKFDLLYRECRMCGHKSECYRMGV